MSADSEFLLPPNEPEAFESLCLDIWKEIWGSESGAQKNGRLGQPQAGVDIYGRHSTKLIGIQCKQRDGLSRTKLSERELKNEVEKAKDFKPPISAFIIATSGERDGKIQQCAREISESNEAQGLFSVEVWTWPDIWHEIYQRENLFRRLLPVYWPRQYSLAGSDRSVNFIDDPSRFRSMARRPEGFVSRAELSQIVARLIEGSPTEDGAPTISLRGPGGFGKTTLAQAACFDSRIQARFSDGVLWVTMGEDLRTSDRLGRIRDLLRWWIMKEPPTFETLEAASSSLRDVLGNSRVLLIVDDAWVSADIAPYSGLPATATVLITTRDSRVPPATSSTIQVDAMRPSEAAELLAAGFTASTDSPLQALSKRLGEWPILLRLVNSELRQLVKDRLSHSQAIQQVEHALDEVGFTAFDRNDEIARELAVQRTVEVSLRRLSPEDRHRYEQLAIFPVARLIPPQVLKRLWKVDGFQTRQLCRRLLEMSLLQDMEPATGEVLLHDVFRTYLQEVERFLIDSIHRELIDSYRPDCPGGLSEGPNDGYYFQNLAYHLAEGLRTDELVDLLFSNAWLRAKLAKTDIFGLADDYHFLGKHADGENLGDALRLSTCALLEAPQELASQLLGRIETSEGTTLGSMISDLRVTQRECWLRPITPRLSRPLGALAWSRKLHTGKITGLIVVNEDRFFSSGEDGLLLVTSLTTGDSSLLLNLGLGSISKMTLLSKNKLVVGLSTRGFALVDLESRASERIPTDFNSELTALTPISEAEFAAGYKNGTLALVNAETGLIRKLAGHSKAIAGIALLDQKKFVSTDRRTIRFWTVLAGSALRTVQIAPLHDLECIQAVGGDLLLAGTFGGDIQVWRADKDKPRYDFKCHDLWVKQLLTADNERGVSSGSDGTIRSWNYRSGEVLGGEVSSGGPVSALAAVGEFAITGNEDGFLSAWRWKRLNPTFKRSVNIFHLVPLNELDQVVSSSESGELTWWNIATGASEKTITAHSGRIGSLCRLGDGRLVSSGNDQTVAVWDARTGRELAKLKTTIDLFHLTPLSGDLVYATSSPTDSKSLFLMLNLQTGTEFSPTELIGSPSGLLADMDRWIFSYYAGPIIVHTTSGESKSFWLGERNERSFALAALGHNMIVTGSTEGRLRLWDLSEQNLATEINGHHGNVTCLATSGDHLVVSGGEDRVIKVWDARSGEMLARLTLDGVPSSVAIMSDGKTIIVSDNRSSLHFLCLENGTN